MDTQILLTKFNANINKNGPISNTANGCCWLWTGDKTSAGYGVINYTAQGKRCRIYAHRFSLLQKLGSLVHLALHHCDNPSCVNPDHLFEGTQKDNTLDMCQKGRWNAGPPVGERNPSAKLTETQVLEIRNNHRQGQSARSLGRQYGVAKGTILGIIHRRNWTHI